MAPVVPGGVLVDEDDPLVRVVLWGTPTQTDYAAVVDVASADPAPAGLRLDLSGLTADPREALALAEHLEGLGVPVELVVAPDGRVARRLRALGTPLRVVADCA